MKSKIWLHHRGNGSFAPRMLIIIASLFLSSILFILLLPDVSRAASLTGNSKTYLQSRESTDSKKIMPIYEYLDFSAQDLGNESISAHFGGWLGYDLSDDSFGKDKDKGRSIQYGYLSYRAKEYNAVVNLGRVMVFEGVASERLDGVYARTDIKGGFGIAAYGGTSSVISDKPENNMVYGGRISHQSAGLYTLGLSYLKQELNNVAFREEEGIDLWLRPVNKVELTGSSSYNVETTGWMEHAYYLMLGPFDKLRFNTEASWINYADYFAGTTTNVFRTTPSGQIDSKEKVNILGEEVFYAIDKNWAASLDYKKYNYDIAGNADYYGAKATYVLPKSYNAGLSIHKMDGDTNRLQYDEYRIYATKTINKLDVTVDLLDVKYKEAINDVTSAYSATLAAGYTLTEKLKLGLDVEYSKNPDFDKEVRLFAKMSYNFEVASSSRKSAAASQEKAAAAPITSAAVTPEQAAPAGAEQGKPKEGN